MVLLWTDRGGLSPEDDTRVNKWTIEIDRALGDNYQWTFNRNNSPSMICRTCSTPVLSGEYRYHVLLGGRTLPGEIVCLDCAYEKVKAIVSEPPTAIMVTPSTGYLYWRSDVRLLGADTSRRVHIRAGCAGRYRCSPHRKV